MLRLLTDENIHGGIVRGLLRQNPELDIVRVQDVGLRTTDDVTLLRWAALENRIIVTKDRNTLIGLAYERVKAEQPMPGILVLPTVARIGEIIDAILLADAASTPDEWLNRVMFLPT